MCKRLSRIVGAVLLLGVICLAIFSAVHPGAAFPPAGGSAYLIYGVCLAIAAVLLIAPFREKKRYISKDLRTALPQRKDKPCTKS